LATPDVRPAKQADRVDCHTVLLCGLCADKDRSAVSAYRGWQDSPAGV